VLVLDNLATNQAGGYSASVSNVVGVTTSSRASLVVRPAPAVPPGIATNPASAMKLAGDTVSFSVAVTGTAPFTYQWSFNGTNMAGATAATLTLSNLTTAQSGNYRVLVSNSAGSTNSRAALLAVRGAAVLAAAVGAAPSNSPPVAVAVVEGQQDLGTRLAGVLILPPRRQAITAVLDGSRSSDPDGDSLRFLWEALSPTNTFVAFASAPRSTNALERGAYSLRLTVGDALHQSRTGLEFSVVDAGAFSAELALDAAGTPGVGEALRDAADALAVDDVAAALEAVAEARDALADAVAARAAGDYPPEALAEALARLDRALRAR
jgi:hypothetical protein